MIDSSHVRTARRGPKAAPSPVGRACPGSRRHVLVDGQGVSLAVSLAGGNRIEVTQLLPLLAEVPSRRGPGRGTAQEARHGAWRPLLRPRQVAPAHLGPRHQTGDRSPRRPARLRTRSAPAGRRAHHRLAARLSGRLRVHWDQRDDTHEAFLTLATCLITHRHAQRLR
ncbi:transposase [Streptomyces sp. NPDC058818]|uniref:transposase n=1 Tax=Streptomyces sp. NPDC058818 TaxID=3346640 RepID=UPI00367647A2